MDLYFLSFELYDDGNIEKLKNLYQIPDPQKKRFYFTQKEILEYGQGVYNIRTMLLDGAGLTNTDYMYLYIFD